MPWWNTESRVAEAVGAATVCHGRRSPRRKRLDESPAVIEGVVVRCARLVIEGLAHHDVAKSRTDALNNEPAAFCDDATRLVTTGTTYPDVGMNVSAEVVEWRGVPETAVHAGVDSSPRGQRSRPAVDRVRNAEPVSILAGAPALETRATERRTTFQCNDASKSSANKESIRGRSRRVWQRGLTVQEQLARGEAEPSRTLQAGREAWKEFRGGCRVRRSRRLIYGNRLGGAAGEGHAFAAGHCRHGQGGQGRGKAARSSGCGKHQVVADLAQAFPVRRQRDNESKFSCEGSLNFTGCYHSSSTPGALRLAGQPSAAEISC